MDRRYLYVIVAVLAAVVIGLGAYVWREESKPSGVEIRIGEEGVSIEQN